MLAGQPSSRHGLALVSMPFASTLRPSIQLGLLKSVTEAASFPAETFHLSLDFAVQIGFELYEAIADGRNPQFGDWIFAIEAFGEDAPDKSDVLIAECPDAARALHK